MAKIFLSYGRNDAEQARRLAGALEDAGYEVWWDRHIRGGAQYSQVIDAELEAAQVVLVLWSSSSIKSDWVRDEAGVGRNTGRLVPARIDNCEPPLGFRQYQTIDLADWLASGHEDELAELLDAIDVSAGGSGNEPRSAARVGRSKGQAWTTRRKLLVGAGSAGALGLSGAAGLVLYRLKNPPIPDDIKAMTDQAWQLMEQNTQAGQYQAIGLFQRVVERMPDYADGWGRLGVAYAVPSHYREKTEAKKLRQQAESAGSRSLELDPGNPYGEMALSAALPFIGHWRERDERNRRMLAAEPKNDRFLLFRGVGMIFDGRAKQALDHYERVRARPFSPAVYSNYLNALWTAGRMAELEQAMIDASSLYPTQFTIWSTRFNILAYEGRGDAAIAHLDNVEGRPTELTEPALEARRLFARAVQTRDPQEVEAVMEERRAMARRSGSNAEQAIRVASTLGQLDDAFAFADAYYFSRGYEVPDFEGGGTAASLDQRQTRPLFEPCTKAMRDDPRFEPLVRELGLDRYWRESGNTPDYRDSRQA